MKVKFLKPHTIFTAKGREKLKVGDTAEISAKAFAALQDRCEPVLTAAEAKANKVREEEAIKAAK